MGLRGMGPLLYIREGEVQGIADPRSRGRPVPRPSVEVGGEHQAKARSKPGAAQGRAGPPYWGLSVRGPPACSGIRAQPRRRESHTTRLAHLSIHRLPRDHGRQFWGRPREGTGLGEARRGWGCGGVAGLATERPAPERPPGGPVSSRSRPRSTPRITRAITSPPAPRPPWAPHRAWQVCARAGAGAGGCVQGL